jgi:hypothetical protein
VGVAIVDALTQAAKKKWKPGKLKTKLEPSIAKNYALLEKEQQKRKK